ncbi:hypothetical protein ACSMXM_05635 [Pacificimonas sp. ICDLI1SI03]
MADAADTPKPFAKLFDTPHGQLLVTRDYIDENDDGEEEEAVVCRGATRHGIHATIKMGGWADAAPADAAFAKVDQDGAEELAATMAKMIDGFSGGAAA